MEETLYPQQRLDLAFRFEPPCDNFWMVNRKLSDFHGRISPAKSALLRSTSGLPVIRQQSEACSKLRIRSRQVIEKMVSAERIEAFNLLIARQVAKCLLLQRLLDFHTRQEWALLGVVVMKDVMKVGAFVLARAFWSLEETDF